MIRDKEEDAATKLKESEENWQRILNPLEEEIQFDRQNYGSQRRAQKHHDPVEPEAVRAGEKKWESKCNALEASYKKELVEKEESC